MTEKVEVSYRPAADEGERLRNMVEILSGGVYAYLTRRGLLKEVAGGVERAANLPKEAPGAGTGAGAAGEKILEE